MTLAMAHTYRATTEIEAPPQAVWEVLADTATWDRWSHFVPAAPGPLAVGESFPIAFPMRGRIVTGQTRIIRCEPNRELTWQGGVALLLKVTHGFTIESIDGGCRLIHSESFAGPLSPVLALALGADQDAKYERVNLALKGLVERPAP